MKKYGAKERWNGAAMLLRCALVYLLWPREIEDRLFRALTLRRSARVVLHGETL